MKIEFNWEQIKKASVFPNGRLVLFYCIVVNQETIDGKLGSYIYDVEKRLNLGYKQFPATLISGKLVKSNIDGVYSNFYCKEPQVYVTSYDFLFHKTSVQSKLDYLELISQRHLQNYNNWVPLDYANRENYKLNPYITITENKLYFTQEKE